MRKEARIYEATGMAGWNKCKTFAKIGEKPTTKRKKNGRRSKLAEGKGIIVGIEKLGG